MRVLVVAPQPFFTYRGTPLSVYYRCLVLAGEGAKVDLLTYGSGMDVDVPGLRVCRIPRFHSLEPVPVGPSWTKAFLDVFMVLWTIGLLLRHRYHAVLAHEEAVFWCRFLKPLFRFRLVYEMHSSLPQQLGAFQFTRSRWLVRLFEWLEKTGLRSSDAVVTVCPDLHQLALKRGSYPDSTVMIENSLIDEVAAIDPTEQQASVDSSPLFDFTPDRPTILYAGTFEAYQGVDLLVEAFRLARDRRPDLRLLLMGGDVAQVARLRTLAESLGVGEGCTLTGTVPRRVVSDYMRLADVLVSPRLTGNNTPLKIYEQLASGRPLVATRIRSHTQVLNNSICFLVEPKAEALAEGLLSALSDAAERERRTANARAHFTQEYSRSAYVGKTRQLLELIR